MANSLKQFQDWMVFSSNAESFSSALSNEPSELWTEWSHNSPPQTHSDDFFLLVYASSAMLCENDGDGGGRGGGVNRIYLQIYLFFILFKIVRTWTTIRLHKLVSPELNLKIFINWSKKTSYTLSKRRFHVYVINHTLTNQLLNFCSCITNLL